MSGASTWGGGEGVRLQVTAQPLHGTWKIAEVVEIRLLVKTTSVGLEPNDPPLFGYASLSAPTMACDLM